MRKQRQSKFVAVAVDGMLVVVAAVVAVEFVSQNIHENGGDDDDGSNDHKDDQHIGDDIDICNVNRILFDSIASMQDQPNC